MRALLPLALLLAGCGDKDDGDDTATDDTATDDTATEVTSGLAVAGNRFGECIGHCTYELSFFTEGGLILRIGEYSADPALVENRGALTASGQQRLATIEAALSGQALDPVYGCPDCNDGGASWATFVAPDSESTHTWEHGNPPSVLADLDGLVQEAISALRACAATADVGVDSGCTPEQ